MFFIQTKDIGFNIYYIKLISNKMKPLNKTKIEKILNTYPNSIILIDDINKIIIDEVVYIEKKTIYQISTLDKIDIKNILNKTSSLRKCLENDTLRTLRISNNQRDYILYSYDDIQTISIYKNFVDMI